MFLSLFFLFFRKEIGALQTENYSLERQLFSYQKSLSLANTKGGGEAEDWGCATNNVPNANHYYDRSFVEANNSCSETEWRMFPIILDIPDLTLLVQMSEIPVQLLSMKSAVKQRRPPLLHVPELALHEVQRPLKHGPLDLRNHLLLNCNTKVGGYTTLLKYFYKTWKHSSIL